MLIKDLPQGLKTYLISILAHQLQQRDYDRLSQWRVEPLERTIMAYGPDGDKIELELPPFLLKKEMAEKFSIAWE